jgi:hypothetical protein
VEPQTKAAAAQAEGTTPNATQTPPDTPANQETIQDSMAQVALGYVDVDPNAEMYWDEATGDPSLSAEEPEGVMGDWNEDDPSDPEGSTTDDLP